MFYLVLGLKTKQLYPHRSILSSPVFQHELLNFKLILLLLQVYMIFCGMYELPSRYGEPTALHVLLDCKSHHPCPLAILSGMAGVQQHLRATSSSFFAFEGGSRIQVSKLGEPSRPFYSYFPLNTTPWAISQTGFETLFSFKRDLPCAVGGGCSEAPWGMWN